MLWVLHLSSSLSLSLTSIQDGGPDDYDLPAPKSANEALAEEAAEAPPGKDGGMDEDMRWARDRTGWAPRFELPKPEDEGTLLDHQTFLDGKLDDKFFGGMCVNPIET